MLNVIYVYIYDQRPLHDHLRLFSWFLTRFKASSSQISSIFIWSLESMEGVSLNFMSFPEYALLYFTPKWRNKQSSDLNLHSLISHQPLKGWLSISCDALLQLILYQQKSINRFSLIVAFHLHFEWPLIKTIAPFKQSSMCLEMIWSMYEL